MVAFPVYFYFIENMETIFRYWFGFPALCVLPAKQITTSEVYSFIRPFVYNISSYQYKPIKIEGLRCKQNADCVGTGLVHSLCASSHVWFVTKNGYFKSYILLYRYRCMKQYHPLARQYHAHL